MLLHEMMKDIKPILRAGFPDHWEEICALAMVRVPCTVPLKQAKDAWEKLYNAEDINPSLNLFEDQDLRLEEQKTLYKKLDKHKIDREKFEELMKKAGKILIVTDMDVEKEEIYHIYKKREVVEKMYFEMGGRGMITEVPKKVMDLDEVLGLHMFPKTIRS